MPDTEFEMGGYFGLPRRRYLSSESSEPVSPLTRPKPTSSHSDTKLSRPHLSTYVRAYSDSAYQQAKRNVSIIEEGDATHDDTSDGEPFTHHSHVNHGEMDRSELDTSQNSSVDSSRLSSALKAHAKKSNEQARTKSSGSRSDASRQHRYRSPKWGSKLAKQSWVERPIGGREASSSSLSTRDRHGSMEVPLASLQALRPPSVVPSQSRSPHPETRVTVEEAFKDPRPQQIPEVRVEQPSRRNSSMTARQILSAPVTAFRRMSKRSSSSPNSRAERPEAPPDLRSRSAMDHQTNLRRHQTGAGLERVASMLEDFTTLELKRQPTSGKMSSYASPHGILHSAGRDLASPRASRRRGNSMELTLKEWASQNSSLVQLPRLLTPYNTPEELATYTVINQNGEPEEFLKVDISIRGQTNYLPSEARRIHTPPLPSDVPGRKQRGFFFDYNSPQDQGFIHGVGERSMNKISNTLGGHTHVRGLNSRTPTSSTQSPFRTGKAGARVKTGDWYATQLAEFDSSSDEAWSPSQKDATMGRPGFSMFELEQQRIRDEAELDHNIPEHLPTSPLCPRHPRYWRIMKGKGSQFRGCWMHGFGEFSIGEKTRYGIEDRVKVL